MAELSEGWAFPYGATKAHYFTVVASQPRDRGGFSLCEKYGFFFNRAALEPDTGPGRDDCVNCRKRLNKRVKQESMR